MGAKIGKAKYCDELKMAEARPRSEVGNHAATMRPLPGNTGDCASPEQMRKMKIAVNAALAFTNPAQPVRNAKVDQRIMAIPYTRFEPKRSSKPPEGSCPKA